MVIAPTQTFPSSGVDLGTNSRDMVYLMGLSDFFSLVFQDRDKVNLMLECSAYQASEIYGKFLQQVSSVSLEGIQTHIKAGLKLIFLTVEDMIDESTYKLDPDIVSCKFLANRPFLPTDYLEEGVDFEVIRVNGETILQLAKPLSNYQFSQRVTGTGLTQFAVWAADVVIDEDMIYKYYGKLVEDSNPDSSVEFADFVYGLYYMYANGPTLDILEKGANLVLGVPIVRGNESVLDIRNYVDSGQYLVITDQNQYLLPSGVPLSIGIGDVLNEGQILSKIVEIRDYISSGVWWEKVGIPATVIPKIPSSQRTRIASQGSPFWQVMKDYLYRHTFSVKITVGEFKNNNEYFRKLSEIIKKARPAYTIPIFSWAVSAGSDGVDMITASEVKFTIRQLDGVNANTINSTMIDETGINS